MDITPIAQIKNDFTDKFGIPRQSMLAENLSYVVFYPEYRKEGILKGIEEFNYLHLIWHFDLKDEDWSPTVRPPRLGGNERRGVFATRSPYRPNHLGLSTVRLVEVRQTEKDGTVLVVSGADLMNGTKIFDIKPYLPFTDCHLDAKGGFAEQKFNNNLEVVIDENSTCVKDFSDAQKQTLTSILRQDPRPAYHEDGRIYGFGYAGREIKFTVKNGVLYVL